MPFKNEEFSDKRETVERKKTVIWGKLYTEKLRN
jgi:hypothetical protein